MGRVYEAEDLELRRVVALKTIGSTAPHAIEALRNELALLSTIDRPDYFPRVYEGFEDSGSFYVPMDRIEGQDLSKFLGEVPVAELDVTAVDRIFEAICYRLHYLHEFPSHQVLFRDLKPANVMVLGSTLEVRLVDFGIAAKVDAARAIRAGTPGFWAPEARSHGRYSVRSDVYALGQLLRCLLWARPAPPDGDEPIPFAKDRGLPPELDAVARKMADRQPDRRPASALLALDSFRRACVAAEPESARSAAHQSCPECGFASLGEFYVCAACGRWLQTPEESPVALDDWPRIRGRLLDMSRQVATDKSSLNRSSHRELLESAAALGRTPGYRELTCLPSIRVEAYPYQRRAALKVLRDFQGRAILADEVGLGKTIEAGLILKEYWVRGEARRALIVVPPALREQWKNELVEKFAFRPEEVLTFGPDGDTTDLSCLDSPRIALIVSHQRARQYLREDLLRRSWDVLIVDEAHHAKRQSKTKMNRLAELLDKVNCRRSIFLTATPAQNDLRELFYLVSLVRPGLVGADAWQFSQRFGGIHGAWAVRAKDELGSLLQRVVVRNRRDEVLRAFPTRVARTFQITLAPAEASAYRSLVSAAQRADVNPLALVDRTRQFCTSYQSLLSGESAGSFTEEVRRLAGTPHFKLRAFLEQVLPSLAEETKILIFSRYRASQREINDALVQARQVSMLAGDSPFERAKSVRRFKTDPSLRFLVCGEALSEGVNLQFCRCMINFDLPWNPQRIEQRIGRIQRLGSPHREVLVVNLAAKGTIEDLVIDYVEKKLKMFEDVFGSVEAVLGQLAEGESIEGFIREALRRGREGQYDPNVAKRGGESIENARDAANAEDGLAGILGLFDGLGTSSEADDAGEDKSEDEGESDGENDGYAGVEA